MKGEERNQANKMLKEINICFNVFPLTITREERRK